MKQIILPVLLLVVFTISVKSQNNPSTNKVATTTPLYYTPPVDSIEEKLVALALNGPSYKASENKNKIDEYQLRSARNNWLNLLTLSLNYNDQTFAKGQTTNYVYPKYFFGFNVPLGTLLSRTQVKSAKEQIQISKNNQEQLARVIRAEVLSKYKEYKTIGELLKLQIQVVDDEQTAFLQTQKNFSNNAIAIDVYNAAQKKFNDEIAKKLQLQLQEDLARLELEKMIGTSLQNVIKN